MGTNDARSAGLIDPSIAATAEYMAGLTPDARDRTERLLRLLTANAMTEEAADEETRARAKGKFRHGRRASTISPQSIDWLWQGFVPLGALSLLYGEEGSGKSALSMALAAMTTRGELGGEPAAVEIVTFEDDGEAVIVPRLIAAGADLDLVTVHDGGGDEDSPLVLPDDLTAFRAALEESGARLVIIDPLPDALREGLKDNNNGDVRRGIRPLHGMARDLGIAILGVSHPNKGATNAADKVLGSKAWRSVPRSVMLFGRDPDDPDGSSRIVAVSKTNYAAGKPARKVHLESVEIAEVAGALPRAVIGGESSYTDQDLIASAAGRVTVPATKADQAERLLFKLLEDGGGEVAARVVFAAGDTAGLSQSTMKRARESIGASPGAVWKLPDRMDM